MSRYFSVESETGLYFAGNIYVVGGLVCTFAVGLWDRGLEI